MKRLLSIAAISICIFLAGCTPGQIKSQVELKVAQQAQPITLADLDVAIADATAHNDQDGLACWKETKAYVLSWPTATQATPPNIAGVASGIQAARSARLDPTPGLPPIPASMHRACAVVIVDAQNVLGRLGITAAAAAKGLAIP